MSILKPTPVVPQVPRNLCPFCGKPSYSRDGIHPQCALDQADSIRCAKLQAARKAQPKPVKVPNRRHLSKTCPDCEATLHIRVNVCSCGHKFN